MCSRGLNSSPGSKAAWTSMSLIGGCSVNRWPPQALHHLRTLFGVLLKLPMCSAPEVILTAPGRHNVYALTGPADQWRHDSQWQYPIATGSPVTRSEIAPQKQLPL